MFGIIICLDSNYFYPARMMISKGATALFVSTNNAVAPVKTHTELAVHVRNVDIARALENSVLVIRADVAGFPDGLVSYGSSGIVDLDGMVVQSAKQLKVDLIVADIDTEIPERRLG